MVSILWGQAACSGGQPTPPKAPAPPVTVAQLPRQVTPTVLPAAATPVSEAERELAKDPYRFDLTKVTQTPTLSWGREVTLKAYEMIRQEPPPEAIIRDTHYLRSNEYQHHLYKPHISDLGGVFVGVGTDQCYLMAAWSKPSHLLLMDFDIWIAQLHRIYGMMFRWARTPKEFQSLWRRDRYKVVLKAITEAEGLSAKDKRAFAEVYRAGRARVSKRLDNVIETYRKLKVPTFLTDQKQYDNIRKLWLSERVLAIRGDLTGPTTMRDIGRFAAKYELPIRLLYLSNAEYYFPFKAAHYRANIDGLHVDDKSVLLRTWPTSPSTYRYFIHPIEDMKQWMQRSTVYDARTMLRYIKRHRRTDLFTVCSYPEFAVASEKRAHRKRRKR